MRYGEKLAEGKTKIIYAHPDDSALAVMVQKDTISAGDGARRHVLEGKGALSGRTAANVFRLLNRSGVSTHLVEAAEGGVMVVHRCTMIPLEVVMRRLATGSYLRRHPDVREGQRFDPVVVEFFLKDDARHDPLIEPEAIAHEGVAAAEAVVEMTRMGRQVFELLEHAWASEGVQLVDLKIEFGRRADGLLVVADMIDNDSWRLWPGGDKGRMLDKQIYRDMREVTEQGLQDVKRRYEQVAEITDRFVA